MKAYGQVGGRWHGERQRIPEKKQEPAKIKTAEVKRESRGDAYKKRRLKKMMDNPEDEFHGTYSGYTCGCRCDRCREAAREYRQNR